jgi:hypothetical protein
VAVDAGPHRLQLAKGGGPWVLDDSLKLSPGQRVDVEALLERQRGAWDAGLRLGAMGFLDSRSRSQLLPPVMAVGVALLYRDGVAPRVGLRLDLLGSTGRATYRQGGQAAPMDYTVFAAGVAAPYRLALSESLVLSAGPRLSAVDIARRFRLDLAAAPQRYFSITPGLLAGVSWESGRWVANLELQADWMVVRVDGASRASGFGALLGGVGYRF